MSWEWYEDWALWGLLRGFAWHYVRRALVEIWDFLLHRKKRRNDKLQTDEKGEDGLGRQNCEDGRDIDSQVIVDVVGNEGLCDMVFGR